MYVVLYPDIMANIKVYDMESSYNYTFSVTSETFNDMESPQSPEFSLSGLTWKVRLRKRLTNNGDAVLGVYLECNFKDKIDYSCEARAAFKLHSSASIGLKVVKQMDRKTFNSKDNVHGIDDFTKWSVLMDPENKFVIQKQATIQVQLFTNPIGKCHPFNPIERTSAKFRLVLEGLSKLNRICSPKQTVRGVQWHVVASKSTDHLSVFLASDENEFSANWSYEVVSTFKLVPFDDNSDPIETKQTDTYDSVNLDWGYHDFVEWSELMDGSFVRNDTAILEVDIKVEPGKPSWEVGSRVLNTEPGPSCSVCFERLSDVNGQVCATKCGHLFCKGCINHQFAGQEKRCPVCNSAVEMDELRTIFL